MSTEAELCGVCIAAGRVYCPPEHRTATTKAEAPELKPCPWCGEKATIRRNGDDGTVVVGCLTNSCEVAPVTVEFVVDKLAIDAWNDRIATADLAPAGEKCEWKRARAPMADWTSSCGSAFYFDEGHTPQDAGFKFCPFCGKEIK
jgi:hypothetical protein